MSRELWLRLCGVFVGIASVVLGIHFFVPFLPDWAVRTLGVGLMVGIVIISFNAVKIRKSQKK